MKTLILAAALAVTFAPMAHAVETISSDAVIYTQEGLRQQGYNAVPVDGVYGPETADAVRSFQQSNNLQPTGSIDVQTLNALNTRAAGYTPVSMNSAQSQDNDSDPLPKNIGTGEANTNANGY